jgi:hypothetical protein
MKIITTILLAVTFHAALAQANSNHKITAQLLSAEIQESGASTVLFKYYDTSVWSDDIMPGIESATTEWLAIAEQLRAVSDAGASEDLGLALYRALAVNPLRVLPLLTSIYGGTVQDRCTISFEPELPKEGVTKYLKRIEAGLKKAKNKYEKAMATECRRGLEITREDAKRLGLK